MHKRAGASVKRILIIEDEPEAAETMKTLVEREGFRVVYTLDPCKGVKMAQDYDLLLLDMIMPTMSSCEVLAEMKNKGVKTPVIVMSVVGLPMEIYDEISNKYPGVVFVPKTEMHTSLPNRIKKMLFK